ncbi:MAG: CBS domain-containing protein, partial [Methanoculleaceae archaeon]
MDLSLIQREILLTLITLYHQHSHPIKGEEIAEVLQRNPGTVRNQMQALKVLELVDGIPGPKGGYTPTARAYEELNLTDFEQESEVPVSRDGEKIAGVRVTEISFITLCHPDLCQARVKIIGSVRLFNIGDHIIIGPTPVNKLIIRGEVIGKDENHQTLLISISEMLSLPKRPIREYMSTPLITLSPEDTFRDAMHIFSRNRIHGAPVIEDDRLQGIVTLSDIARGLDEGYTLDDTVDRVMTTRVVEVEGDLRIY